MPKIRHPELTPRERYKLMWQCVRSQKSPPLNNSVDYFYWSRALRTLEGRKLEFTGWLSVHSSWFFPRTSGRYEQFQSYKGVKSHA